MSERDRARDAEGGQGGLTHDALVRVERLGVPQWVLRRWARRRIGTLRPGAVTVVIASWNSMNFLEVALAAVRRFADRDTDIVVVDNHSTERPSVLTSRYEARLVRLPVNLRHSVALDLGFLLARTEYVMALDVDAFPYSQAWLSTFLDPLGEGRTVVGCEWYRPYAHPCCLAMRTEDFIDRVHTFRPNYPVGSEFPEGCDVGERISRVEGADRVGIIPKTRTISGTGYFSACYGDVVYHNCYSTRHLHLPDPERDVLSRTESYAMTRPIALQVWHEALGTLGPDTWPPDMAAGASGP